MVHIYNDIIKYSPMQCLVLRRLNVYREADTDLELVTINGMDMFTSPLASCSHSFTRLLVRLPEFEYPISPIRNSACSIWGNPRKISGERLVSSISTPRRTQPERLREHTRSLRWSNLRGVIGCAGNKERLQNCLLKDPSYFVWCLAMRPRFWHLILNKVLVDIPTKFAFLRFLSNVLIEFVFFFFRLFWMSKLRCRSLLQVWSYLC